MDFAATDVSIQIINMRVSFKARIADDDHSKSTSSPPVGNVTGFCAGRPYLLFFYRPAGRNSETRTTQQYGTERVAYG